MTFHVRAVTAADESQWSALYEGYRSFYKLPQDEQSVHTTWTWVSSESHGLRGLVAVDENDVIIGLANLRRFARPATGTIGLYLDDLFTSPPARGAGVGTALLHEAAVIAAQQGASVVRWITAEDNETARRTYDKVASATSWITYDMKPLPD